MRCTPQIPAIHGENGRGEPFHPKRSPDGGRRLGYPVRSEFSLGITDSVPHLHQDKRDLLADCVPGCNIRNCFAYLILATEFPIIQDQRFYQSRTFGFITPNTASGDHFAASLRLEPKIQESRTGELIGFIIRARVSVGVGASNQLLGAYIFRASAETNMAGSEIIPTNINDDADVTRPGTQRSENLNLLL